MNRSVSDSDACPEHVDRTPSNTSSAASSAESASTGGVPDAIRVMPSAGAKARSMSNGRACPNHPVTGWSQASWCRGCTQANAGEPGPPLRYL